MNSNSTYKKTSFYLTLNGSKLGEVVTLPFDTECAARRVAAQLLRSPWLGVEVELHRFEQDWTGSESKQLDL